MPDPTPVTPQTEQKLRQAIGRLLAGRPLHTDGRLVKENLYREAGVSRATMNRARTVLADWDRVVDGDTRPRDARREQTDRDLADARAQITALHARIRLLEQQLTLAATAVAELHTENRILRGQDTPGNITPLRRPHPNTRPR